MNYSWNDAVTAGLVLDFIYGWDESGQTYELSSTLLPGDAYWVYAYNNCDMWVTGETNDDDLISELFVEWNFVGLPYDTSVDKENLTVLYSDTLYSWNDAVTAGIILDFIYKWNAFGQSYDLTDILTLGEGCWMYAYYNCTLKKS